MWCWACPGTTSWQFLPNDMAPNLEESGSSHRGTWRAPTQGANLMVPLCLAENLLQGLLNIFNWVLMVMSGAFALKKILCCGYLLTCDGFWRVPPCRIHTSLKYGPDTTGLMTSWCVCPSTGSRQRGEELVEHTCIDPTNRLKRNYTSNSRGRCSGDVFLGSYLCDVECICYYLYKV